MGAIEAGASLLERHFKVHESGSTVRGEVVAGLTTFMTMAYILFVNPQILGSVAGFVSYTTIKLLRGKARDVHWMMYAAALAFLVYFAIRYVRTALGIA